MSVIVDGNWGWASPLTCSCRSRSKVDGLWWVPAMGPGAASVVFEGEEKGEKKELARRSVMIRLAYRLCGPSLAPVPGEIQTL